MGNIIFLMASALITPTNTITTTATTYTQTQQPASASAGGSDSTIGLEVGLMLLALLIMGALWVYNKLAHFNINSPFPFPDPSNYNNVSIQTNWTPAYNNTNNNGQQPYYNNFNQGDGEEDYEDDEDYDDEDGEEDYDDEDYYADGNDQGSYYPGVNPLVPSGVPATTNYYNQLPYLMPPLSQQPIVIPTPPAPPLSLRERTLRALEVLPAPNALPMPSNGEYEIPFMYDGQQWLSIRLGRDGDWGIFGQKGGGKGNLLQHIVIQALWMGPEKVHLVVIDRKSGLDYSFCEEVAHAKLYYNQQITDGLHYLINEMYRRGELFRKCHARDLGEYMQVTGQNLPLVVCVLDEIADYDKKQKDSVETLVRMARASGFVIFLATQYPTAEVLSSQIQANVTNRVVFKLASSQNNWVALRRTSEKEGGLFDPSAIPLTRRGVGVCRLDAGDEYLGQVPEVRDDWRRQIFAQMIGRWPKHSNDTFASAPIANVANSITNASAVDGVRSDEGDEMATNLSSSSSQSDLEVRNEVRGSSGVPSEVRGVRNLLSTTDFVRVAMEIAAGERTRTDIIKSMPGYQGPLYKEFAAFYDEIAAGVKTATNNE